MLITHLSGQQSCLSSIAYNCYRGSTLLSTVCRVQRVECYMATLSAESQPSEPQIYNCIRTLFIICDLNIQNDKIVP